MPENRLKVLVTGATGLIGSHSVRALLRAGHEVRAFVRSPEKARRVFGPEADLLDIAPGDTGDAESVRSALRGCDAVLHCAAMVAVGKARDSDAMVETNVAGVRNVIGAAVDEGLPRIVHVSSLATLFRGDGTILTESSEPRESEHAYGKSKAISDRYVRSLQDKGDPVKIIYPGSIIGPDDPGLSESMNGLRAFITDFTPLTTAGMQFVDARDLAIAHLCMLEAEPGPARYLAGGTFLSWSEIAAALRAATDRPVRTIRFPGPVLRGMGRFIDLARRVIPIELPLTAEAAAYVTRWDPVPNSKAFEEMGATFRDVRESIADAVRWLEAAGYLERKKE